MFRKGPILFFILLVAYTASATPRSVEWDFNYILDTYQVSTPSVSKTLSIGSLMTSGEVTSGEHRYHMSAQGAHSNGSPSEVAQDIQILSNIDMEGEETLKIYELYYSYQIQDFELSLGWQDLSNHFNRLAASELLIHSSFGTSADLGNTGFYGPSIYPFPGFGLKANHRINEKYQLRFAISDPLNPQSFRSRSLQSQVNIDPDNYFAIFEIKKSVTNYQWNMGAWTYRAEASSFLDFQQSGIYFDWEYYIARWTPFAKIGLANKRPLRVHQSWVLGLKRSQVFNSRDWISIGIVIAPIDQQETHEKVFEVLYKRQLAKGLAALLSFQSIEQAFFSQQRAQALTLRIEIGKALFL